MEVKEEIDKSIIIVEDKIDNCIEELNNQLNLIYIYRIVYPTTAEYIFLASVHGTFTKIDHILSHKSNLNTFKGI